MTLKYDPSADAFYLRVVRGASVVESDEIDPGLIVNFGPDNRVVAIVLLDAAARLAAPTSRPAVRYDREADVLDIRINPSPPTTHSELTDDDIMIRYNTDAIIGRTVLRATQRLPEVTP